MLCININIPQNSKFKVLLFDVVDNVLRFI